MEFERGFKSWAERVSGALRKDLGLQQDSPLEPVRLAEYLDVRLCTPGDVPGLPKDVLNQLLIIDPSGWSAVSIFEDSFTLVIYNPRHSKGRQASDIMHELAHLILEHKAATMIISQDGKFVMRSYNDAQEHEANWLAWCLLLPRDVLLRCGCLGMSAAEIATRYGVSEKLVNFRLRITGVEAQLRAAARRGRRGIRVRSA